MLWLAVYNHEAKNAVGAADCNGLYKGCYKDLYKGCFGRPFTIMKRRTQ